MLVALLVITAHLGKRARRARKLEALRRLELGLEPEPEPEGPLWIIEEKTLALALGAVIAIIVVGSAGVAIGQRVLASQRKRAAKLSEAETAKAATAARKTALADAKAAFAQAKTAARARNEADRQAQKRLL